jgi:hypothetical protein
VEVRVEVEVEVEVEGSEAIADPISIPEIGSVLHNGAGRRGCRGALLCTRCRKPQRLS